MIETNILEQTSWVFIRHSVLLIDGTWMTETTGQNINFWEEPVRSLIRREQYPYFYFDPSRGDQSCIATIEIHEREWIHESAADRKISKDIEVSFNKELGNEAGSWKGGIVGCSYEMLPNERPVDALRRMEKDRTFK